MTDYQGPPCHCHPPSLDHHYNLELLCDSCGTSWFYQQRYPYECPYPRNPDHEGLNARTLAKRAAAPEPS